MPHPVPVAAHLATALVGVPQGFRGARGGISTGVVAGLSVGLGSAVAPAAVAWIGGPTPSSSPEGKG